MGIMADQIGIGQTKPDTLCLGFGCTRREQDALHNCLYMVRAQFHDPDPVLPECVTRKVRRNPGLRN